MKDTKQARTGKDKILDAAEALFATSGYYGASLREITRAAGVELGLSSYHFRSKDELYRQVLLRRAPEMASDLISALERRPQASTNRDAVSAILNAYVETHMAKLQSRDAGWRSYVRLAAQAALFLKGVGVTGAAAEIYGPTIAQYKTELTALVPQSGHAAIERQFYVFQMALFGIALDISGAVSDQAGLTEFDESLGTLIVEMFTSALIGD